MLRKALTLFMVIVLCLSVCACKNVSTDQPTQTTSGSAENTQSTGNTEDTKDTESMATTAPAETTKATEPPETTETTEPSVTIEPTEPPVSELSVADWQLEKPNYLSYEEYFSVEREFTVNWLSENPTKWVKGNRKFTVVNKDGVWSVWCEETDEHYYIPLQDGLADYSNVGADGRYGYFGKIDSFVQVDLATGERKVLLEGQQIRVGIVRDNLVHYYLSTADGKLTLGRCYLPTGEHEIFVEMPGEFYGLAFDTIYNTTDPLVFSMYNPDMIDLLKAELANPNSQYKQMWVNNGETCWDFSEIWEAEDGLMQIFLRPALLHLIQDASGVRAFLQCTYHLSDGTLTKKTGIIDNCFHGSGYPHDHFNPEITTAEPVEVIMGQKKDLLNQMPEIFGTETTQADILLLPDVDSNSYLYVKTDGDYKKILNTPVSLAVNAGSGAICISADKQSVFAINYEDAQPVEIYRTDKNHITATDRIFDFNFNRERPWFVIRDGDTLVQLDLIAGKSRELVRHPYILPYYYVDPDETTVYFDVAVGLYVSGFTIDMETGELREDYRL